MGRATLLAGALALSSLAACGDRGADLRPPTDPGAAHPLPSAARGAPGPNTPGLERASPSASGTGAAVEPFADEAAARGLDYVNHSGEPEKRTILEANGAGVALLDLGPDGDLDIVFAQGLASLSQALEGPGADLEVFENQGGGRFERVAGPGLSGWWTGLATGDLDGDGDSDLVAGGYGALRVLLQQEGRLVPAADLLADPPGARLEPGAPREAGAAPAWTSSLCLFDADRDGRLDLYVGRYLSLDPLDPPLGRIGEGPLSLPCEWRGYPVYCGPRGLPAQRDRLLRGAGDGTFRDETEERLPQASPGYTLGVLAADLDGDGDSDLFVAADSSPNLLWINDGDGRFREVGYEAGVALSPDGRPQAGMGVAAGDVNRDGLPDLVVTNFSDEPTALYLSAGVGFEDMTFRYGLGRETQALLSWGAHLIDFDGDSWLELFTANGHVYPQADLEGTGTRYGQPDTLWRLGPLARAVRVPAATPRSVLHPAAGTRGSATGDLDGDGDPDLVLVRLDGPAALGVNRFAPEHHRLSIELRGPPPGAAEPKGPRTPPDANGARVVCVVGAGKEEFALLAEVRTAAGYQSASDPAVHLGLGTSARYSALRVLWPSGRVTELPGGQADRRLVIVEGEGLVSSRPLAPRR